MSKYIVDVIRSAKEDTSTEQLYKGNDILKALTKWFEANSLYPSCVAINCYIKEDALKLLEFANSNKTILKALYDKYNSPYKWEYIEEGIQRKINDNCHGFLGKKDWITDMIYPFDIG